MTTMTLEDRKAFTCVYLATPASVRVARRAAEQAARGWGLKRGHVEDVGLVVSELFTNATNERPHSEIRLRISQYVTNSVMVEVWDPSPERPRRKHPGLTDPGGRGLEIVEALACRYGSRSDGAGKTVFAVIPSP